MGFTRRVVFISAALSVVITALLLAMFSRLGGAHPMAEAADRVRTGDDRPEPAAPSMESPARAADAPSGSATDGDAEKRIRTIARNLLTPTGKVNTRAVMALQALGPEVIPVVLHRFTGEETPEQEAILSVLEAFSEPEVAHHLMSVLPQTHSLTMARKIGGAIHTLGDAQFCEQLVALASDRNEAARLAAVIALRTCPAETCATALVRQLSQDPSSACRMEALESLRPAPGAFVDEGVRIALVDDVADIRLAAVKTIARRKAASFLEDLKRLTRSDPSPHVRKASAQALVELRMRAGTPADAEE